MQTRWLNKKNDETGVNERFYPITHTDAIVDFDTKIQEISGNSSKNAVVHNDLSEVDLNTITHACCGYAYLCTNKPTGNNGYFECVPIEGGSICLQRYTPYGDITYYRQLYTDGTWSEWSTQFLPLIGGTLSGNLIIEKGSSVSHTLKNTTTGRQARITATGDNYFSMYNENTADPNNNKVAIWLGNEDVALENVIRINHVLDGSSNTYKLFGEHNTINTKNNISITRNVGTLQFYIPDSSATGILFKNATSTADYGTSLADVSSDGKRVYLRLSGSEQNAQIVKKSSSSATEQMYDIYGTHNITKGTGALTAGSSSLATNSIYVQYE